MGTDYDRYLENDRVITEAFAWETARYYADDIGGWLMGASDLQLPPGTFSAHNIPVQTMPWVVASALAGCTFFKEERVARAYAARLISRGEELEVVLMQVVPIAVVRSKVDATATETQELHTPILPPGSASSDAGSGV